MDELVKLVEKNLRREFPDSDVKLEWFKAQMANPEGFIDFSSLIVFNYTLNGNRISYKLVRNNHRVSSYMIDRSDNKAPGHILRDVIEQTKDAFINNLLYARGEINMVSLLEGNAEPNPECMI